jgi:hypothetical protein
MDDPLTLEEIAQWRVRKSDVVGLERLGAAPDDPGAPVAASGEALYILLLSLWSVAIGLISVCAVLFVSRVIV